MRRLIESLLGVALLGVLMLHGRARLRHRMGRSKTWNFESDEPGKIAAGFTSEVGIWEVVRDKGDNKVLAQKAKNDDDTFNVVLVDGSHFKDFDLSVRLKAVAGELDQGGGVVWRAKDKNNYYIARYNPLEDNFRVYKVEGGKRTQFASAKTPGDKKLAHSPRHDGRGQDHLLPRWNQISRSRGFHVSGHGQDRPLVEGGCSVLFRRPERQ